MEPTGVQIENFEIFSRNGISVLKKFCDISSLRAKIYYEERWLLTSQDGLSATEVSSIEQVLWNHRVGETILRAGQKSVDVGSFSTLVGERYLDNFVIDAAILHYLQDGQDQVGSKALYLPSETHTWLNTNNEPFINRKLQEVLAVSRKSESDLLLLPLHTNGSHWGLVVIDLLGRQLLFDDGYKLKPATGVLTTIKHILDVFHQLLPGSLYLSNFFWTSAKLMLLSVLECHLSMTVVCLGKEQGVAVSVLF